MFNKERPEISFAYKLRLSRLKFKAFTFRPREEALDDQALSLACRNIFIHFFHIQMSMIGISETNIRAIFIVHLRELSSISNAERNAVWHVVEQ